MFRIIFIIVFLFTAVSQQAHSNEVQNTETIEVDTSLIEHLVSLDLASGFESKLTPTGADFYSKAMMTSDDGTTVNKAMMIVEGALPAPKGVKTIEDATNYNINLIVSTTKLNSDYPKENLVAKGMGAEIIDVNGTKVGLLNFQTPDMQTAKMTRVIILKENRLYSFQLVSFDTESHDERTLNLWALVIVAVNSGRL